VSLAKRCLSKLDFPIFKAHPDLVYLDSAATTHKPQCVIDAISEFYSKEYATVNRSVYQSAMHATDLYASARVKIARFIGAQEEEIVFTSGTTESINLVARAVVQAGDEVIISEMEHHSNIVPWQLVCREKGATLKVIPIKNGQLDLATFRQLLSNKTRIVSIAHISNVLGVKHPIEAIIEAAHEVDAQVLIDGAQAAAHETLNLTELGADFYAFSGHKMYGPTGIGILYGRNLDALPPIFGGGDMIDQVTMDKSTFQKAPQKFEAGTPKIAQVIGLGAAIDYLEHQDRSHIATLSSALHDGLKGMDRIHIHGAGATLVTFSVEGVHPLDVASLLDFKNIAIRSGHLCAQPTMAYLGAPSVLRASLGIYNAPADIEALLTALESILKRI